MAPMNRRDKWRRFFDRALVEWALFGLGCLLILAGLLIAPLPGPGGIFLIAPGVALVLKTSMWAKRRYVHFKKRWPKWGHWTDWGMRRASARRRRTLAKQAQMIDSD